MTQTLFVRIVIIAQTETLSSPPPGGLFLFVFVVIDDLSVVFRLWCIIFFADGWMMMQRYSTHTSEETIRNSHSMLHTYLSAEIEVFGWCVWSIHAECNSMPESTSLKGRTGPRFERDKKCKTRALVGKRENSLPQHVTPCDPQTWVTTITGGP